MNGFLLSALGIWRCIPAEIGLFVQAAPVRATGKLMTWLASCASGLPWSECRNSCIQF